MEPTLNSNHRNREAESETGEQNYYRRLFRRFVLLTIVCSLIPLLLVGWGIHLNYTRFAKDRMIDSFQNQAVHHKKIIEQFLKKRMANLMIVANILSKAQLADPQKLHAVFQTLNFGDSAFEDLGVIDARGNHLAYVGPFDLLDKKYGDTFWFQEVMKKGVFISDMFTGFRHVPHFIIAVLREENGDKWILRATINAELFRSLVESAKVGLTGEVLLLNREGIFQTNPRFSGKIMEKAAFPVAGPHDGITIDFWEHFTETDGRKVPRQVVAHAWLDEPTWLLVIRQDRSEALEAVNHANRVTLIFLHLSALIILVVTVLITRHMIGMIRKRDVDAEKLNRQYLQASKMASIGELSAGVAHEINNPLAIILTERQILLDMARQPAAASDAFEEQFYDSMAQIDVQIQRCKRITQNLLRFSRRTQSVIETVDLNEFIREVVELMEREARTSGIKFMLDLDETLPHLQSDPSQLQQVFLNMITNALDAHDGKPYGTIRIDTRKGPSGQGVTVVFADTGVGIPAEIQDKIFDPFFTTKPVGKGTGLGLSICYSIVRRLGGEITVKSQLGEGTEFTMSLPLEAQAELKKTIAEV